MTVKFRYGDRDYDIESMDEGDHIHRIIQQTQTFYEIKLLEKIKELNLSGVYIDLGSHVGNHSLYFATQCKSTKLICVDAHPVACQRLKSNFRRNNLDIPVMYNYAISDKVGGVTLSPLNCSAAQVVKDEGEIPSTTIDILLGDLEDVALMKIDIEWYEARALKHAHKFFQRNSPVLAIECSNEDAYKSISGVLSGYGYKTDRVNYAITPTYIFLRN